MTYENTSGYMRDSKRRKVSLVVFMALGDIGLVPLLLMHTHSGDTRLYLSAEYAESHIGFQAILLQTIVNVATCIGKYFHMKKKYLQIQVLKSSLPQWPAR